MLRVTGRVLLILLFTAVISGGVYMLGQTEMGRTILGVGGDMAGGRGRDGGPDFAGGLAPGAAPATDGAKATVDAARGGLGQRPGGVGQGAGARGQRPDAAAGAAGNMTGSEGQRPQGGRGEEGHGRPGDMSMGLAGILRNVGIIAVFTVIIVLAQTLWKTVTRMWQPRPA